MTAGYRDGQARWVEEELKQHAEDSENGSRKADY